MRAAPSVPVLLLAAALACTTCASTGTAPAPGDGTPPLFDDLGGLHHPITTRVPRAQRYFDQGLMQTFGFNHQAAVRSFQEAARLDPACAMCSWGVALALGPNINWPMGPEAARRAYQAVQTAQRLAPGASAVEREYIDALAKRYASDPSADRAALDRAYAEAMRGLHRRHPDDLDAATLFAEALMDLYPWNYWTSDAQPREHTEEIVQTLEAVLARDPHHVGANHYYIHAVEEYFPEKAEAAADRLAAVAATNTGHLVHMPSHIYMRLGRYGDALEINRRAARADEAYFAWCQKQGLYGALYYPHNVHFLWSVALVEGRSQLALTSGRKLVAEVSRLDPAAYPFVQDFLPTATFTLLRFGLWDQVLGEPQPAADQRYVTGVWHYARGLALARQDRLANARQEHARLEEVAAEDAVATLQFFGGTAQQNLRIAAHHLAGEMATQIGDYDTAVVALEEAVRMQDALLYTEPPPWYFPVRQALGAVLLEAGRAGEAEAAYRADLEKNPKNGWSLFGLARSLRAQGRDAEAALVERGFAHAWARADVTLTASRF